jgi:glutamate racemase
VSDARPIGVFDSGLGGLTVVRELARLMPGERVVYLGDTARFPYGNRSAETIGEYGMQDAALLMGHDIKMLVVACNTVSSTALDRLERSVKEIPVIGVVLPGTRAAVMRTAERKVGVIGTAATIASGAYQRAIVALDPAIKVFAKACPLLVPIVEEGLLDHEISRLAAYFYLEELLNSGVDCIILGCSHYPLLMETIQSMVGMRTHLVDSALWTAKEAQDILMALNAFSPEKSGGLAASRFLFTDVGSQVMERAAAFLGSAPATIEKCSMETLKKI